jgi:hypothetical protein
MLKNFMIPAFLLLLGWTASSQAHPLDSPDIVYIDGVACNTACQAYMSWSRRLTSSVTRPTPLVPHSSYAARRGSTVHRYKSEPVPRTRVARPVIPLPPARTAKLSPAGKAAAASEVPAAHTPASPSAGDAVAVSDARTIQEQVTAAAALAEQVTTAAVVPGPAEDANDTEGRAQSARPADDEQSAAEPAVNTSDLVALVIARLEIKSIADLAGRDVAIEEGQSASSGAIQTAIAASGAAEVQLSAGPAKAIDRLIDGEVPAAVLALVSTEAAEWFPEVEGFRIYRVPLSPR